MNDANRLSTGSKRLLGFGLIQLAILSCGAAWAAYRFEQHEAERVLPVPRPEPLHIAPLYDEPEVVSDEQLVQVLNQLKPRLRGSNPAINRVDHALRFWGVEAVFDDPETLSGVEMRELLLDHRQYQHAWGEKTLPLLISDEKGVQVRTQEGNATASHWDHTLASLAEVGTPLDYPVITPDGETRLNRLLEWSLRNFSLNQVEYEWSALTYALYLPPARRWFSTEGQEITFDRLADRIMRQRLNSGVCFGNHRLHALVTMLRVNDDFDILSDAARRQIIEHLKAVTARFVATQHADGYWDQDWPGYGSVEEEGAASSERGPLTDRILATGHVMEWWSLSPQEVLPPHDVLVRAGQWLSVTIIGLTEKEVDANFTFLTHAGHALALWRSRRPIDVITSP